MIPVQAAIMENLARSPLKDLKDVLTKFMEEELQTERESY